MGASVEVTFLTTIIDNLDGESSVSLVRGSRLNNGINVVVYRDVKDNTWESLEKAIQMACQPNMQYHVMLLNFRNQPTEELQNPLKNLQSIVDQVGLVVNRYDDLHYVTIPNHLKKACIPHQFFSKKKIIIILEKDAGVAWHREVPIFCLARTEKNTNEINNQSDETNQDDAAGDLTEKKNEQAIPNNDEQNQVAMTSKSSTPLLHQKQARLRDHQGIMGDRVTIANQFIIGTEKKNLHPKELKIAHYSSISITSEKKLTINLLPYFMVVISILFITLLLPYKPKKLPVTIQDNNN